MYRASGTHRWVGCQTNWRVEIRRTGKRGRCGQLAGLAGPGERVGGREKEVSEGAEEVDIGMEPGFEVEAGDHDVCR
jgi:hypothetical protein